MLALDARVAWEPPATLSQLGRTTYRWGQGDGNSGLRGRVFKALLGIYVVVPAVAVAVGLIMPWAAVAAVAVPMIDGFRRTRYKYRWADGLAALLIPLAHLVATYASLLGFLVGRRRRMATS